MAAPACAMWNCRLSNGLTAEQIIIAIVGWLVELRKRGVDLGGGPMGRVGVSRSRREALRKRLHEIFETQPLTDTERRLVAGSMEQFLAKSTQTAQDVSDFVSNTLARLRTDDARRDAATLRLVQDATDAAAQQQVDNRRRAIILTILLMLF